MIETSNCQSCTYFEVQKTSDDRLAPNLGLCRANPPISVATKHPIGIWPTVKESDWCGKYSN